MWKWPYKANWKTYVKVFLYKLQHHEDKMKNLQFQCEPISDIATQLSEMNTQIESIPHL